MRDIHGPGNFPILPIEKVLTETDCVILDEINQILTFDTTGFRYWHAEDAICPFMMIRTQRLRGGGAS